VGVTPPMNGDGVVFGHQRVDVAGRHVCISLSSRSTILTVRLTPSIRRPALRVLIGGRGLECPL